MKKLNFEVYGKTDVGLKSINEDGFAYEVLDVGEHYAGIFAIADGVGGLENGEVASSMAICEIQKWWKNEFKKNHYNEEHLNNSLIITIKSINDELIQYSKLQSMKMATTLSLLFLYKNKAFLYHIGDSRIYRFSNTPLRTTLKQLTTDHSTMVKVLNNRSIVQRNVLTDCLGVKQVFHYETKSFSIQNGDVYILCSDGLYKTMNRKKLKKYIKKYKVNMKNMCDGLLENVKRNGETDNATVIAIKIRNKNP